MSQTVLQLSDEAAWDAAMLALVGFVAVTTFTLPASSEGIERVLEIAARARTAAPPSRYMRVLSALVETLSTHPNVSSVEALVALAKKMEETAGEMSSVEALFRHDQPGL